MVAIPLSDEDWSRISHLFTEDTVPRFGRPRRAAREVLDAVLWVIVNGEKWHHLPPAFPPQQTCYISEMEEMGHHGRGIPGVGNHPPLVIADIERSNGARAKVGEADFVKSSVLASALPDLHFSRSALA